MVRIWKTEQILDNGVPINDRDDEMKWAYVVASIGGLDRKLKPGAPCLATANIVMNVPSGTDYWQLQSVGLFTCNTFTAGQRYSEDGIREQFNEVMFFTGENVKRKQHHDSRNIPALFEYVSGRYLVVMVRGVLVTTSNRSGHIEIAKMQLALARL